MPRDLLSPREIGTSLGVSHDTILRWHEEGAIPAEIAEGRIYRFDLDRVRAALAKRASKAARKGVRKP